MSSRHLAIAVLSAVGLSCSDPVFDNAVNNQGKETQNIPKGEFHRAGQQCVLCHQDSGPASGSIFTLAGTVFAQPQRQVGVGGVEIQLTDSNGAKYISKTNCVGNFFIKPTDWVPNFPILVQIAKAGTARQMVSPIGRSPDCAFCHQLDIPPTDPLSQMPHLYLYSGDEPGLPNGDPLCPVDPVRPGSP
jgi:hypothetical protein